jgi:hypothetical protein
LRGVRNEIAAMFEGSRNPLDVTVPRRKCP